MAVAVGLGKVPLISCPSHGRYLCGHASCNTHALRAADAPPTSAIGGLVFLASTAWKVLPARRRLNPSVAVRGWHPGAVDVVEAEDEVQEVDESGSYSDLGTHREMLEDAVRTEAFREAIFKTCKDKTVLEVGSGSGILAIFAAQAGARHVVAVEADAEMAELAQQVVDANGLGHVVVLQGRVEEVAKVVDQTLNGSKVDVLISEWMGFMLVSEDMFRSVAFARDRWLCEGGQMLPQRCRLHAAPFSHDDFVEKQTGFWGSKPYGVDLSILAFHALDQHICRPVIQILKEEQLLGNSCLLFDLDCKNAARDDARKQECKFLSRIKQPGRFHGVAAWFDCELVPGVHFTTGPEGIATHWEQTLLFLDPASEIMDLMLDEGDEIEGELRWLVAGKDLGVVVLGKVRRKDGTASNDEDLRFGRRLVLNLI